MKRIMLVLVLACCVAGCALTTDQVVISYAPQQSVAAIPEAKGVVVSVVVNDERVDKSNKVGCKKNGFGVEMAPILAAEEVTMTIRRAIETEIKARGFTLGNEASVRILGALSKFYNDHKMGFFAGDAVAELNLNVEVKNSGGTTVYTRSLSVEGVEENTQLATGNNARKALEKALANGLRLLFSDHEFLAALLTANGKSAS